VDTWSSIVNDEGKSILQVFYEDRKRWSYTFQNCALLTRYQCIESAIERAKVANRTGKVVFLTERCLDTDYHVFTKMLMSEGSIDKLEHNLYERLLSQLRTTATPLSAIVHVNTIPTVCAERIKKRSRIGEGNIPLTYLESLNKYQREWIESSTVPSISSDCDFVDISIIESFIENLQT
jgi:deoxyadenosine/deoxycytidine kinase